MVPSFSLAHSRYCNATQHESLREHYQCDATQRNATRTSDYGWIVGVVGVVGVRMDGKGQEKGMRVVWADIDLVHCSSIAKSTSGGIGSVGAAACQWSGMTDDGSACVRNLARVRCGSSSDRVRSSIHILVASDRWESYDGWSRCAVDGPTILPCMGDCRLTIHCIGWQVASTQGI